MLFFKGRIVLLSVLICLLASATSYADDSTNSSVNSSVSSESLTAEEIIYTSEERYDGNTQMADSSMLLIDAAGNKRMRKMKSFRRDFGDDLKDQKTVYFFQYPEDIKDTSYLNFDWQAEGVDDDSWLYLPALNKVKRLSPANKSDAFLGSDFTYTDIKTSTRQYWDYQIVNHSVMVDGHECWHLEGNPKQGKEEKTYRETGYNKIHVWVRKDNFIKSQVTFWVVKGKKIKYLTASDIEKIDGIWTVKSTQISTTKQGKVEHTTLVKLDNVIYDQAIDESYFTPQKMRRGI